MTPRVNLTYSYWTPQLCCSRNLNMHSSLGFRQAKEGQQVILKLDLCQHSCKFTSAVFCHYLWMCQESTSQQEIIHGITAASEQSIALKRREEITLFLGYRKPFFSSAGIICSHAWFTWLLKMQIYCLGSNARMINSPETVLGSS